MDKIPSFLKTTSTPKPEAPSEPRARQGEGQPAARNAKQELTLKAKTLHERNLSGLKEGQFVRFDDLAPYTGVLVDTQMAIYDEIYKGLKEKYDNDPNRPADFHDYPCPALIEPIVKRLFPLAKDFVEKEGIASKRGDALFLMEKLYEYACDRAADGTLSINDFWRLNNMVALIVDWQKGAIDGVEERSLFAEFEPLKFSFDEVIQKWRKGFEEENGSLSPWDMMINGLSHHPNDFKDANVLLGVGDSDVSTINIACMHMTKSTGSMISGLDYSLPYVVYTQKAGLSFKSFLPMAKRLDMVITNFNCQYQYRHHELGRLIKEGTYVPHNNVYATSNMLRHDLDHAAYRVQRLGRLEEFRKKLLSEDLKYFWDEDKIIHPLADFAENLPQGIKKEEADMVLHSAFFFIFEFFEPFNFSDPNTYADAIAQLPKLQPLQHTVLYLRIFGDRHGPDALLEVNSRDYQLLLDRKIDSNRKETEADREASDSIRFSTNPYHDSDGKPLLPNADELLAKAVELAQKKGLSITLDKSQSKRNQWKQFPKEIKTEAKRFFLRDGFKRYFHTIADILERYADKA
jgi:hypothetical protein